MTDRHAGAPRVESDDIQMRWFVRFAAGLVLSGALILFGVWKFYDVLRLSTEQRDVRRSGVQAASPLPPPPRLQPDPREELEEYRDAQNEILRSYGWASRQEGRVRVPIERAMRLLVEQQKGAKP